MEHDMTSGNITRQIFSFSLPIVMGNIFQQLYNTFDAMIVGRMIGKNAFAAVSVANPIMSVVLFFLVGLCMGVGVLLAQRYGAKAFSTFKIQYSTALIAGIVFTIISGIICIVCSRWMLLVANTPSEILNDTNWYLKTIFVGMFFSFLYNYFASALRAIGDSRAAFIFLVISSLVNIVLDIVFIKLTPLGVVGAAIATVLSQALSALLCIIYIYRSAPLLALHPADFIFEPKELKSIIVFSWASALQQTFLYFGRLLIQGTINAHGTDMITGYNAAIRLESFIMAFIDGTGSAIGSFTGQNKGADKPDRMRTGLFRTMQLNCAWIVFCGILMYTIPTLLIGMYVDSSNTEAIRLGVTYISIMPIFYLLCGIMSPIQGFFRGVGKNKITMIATGSQIITRCLLAFILVPRYGIYGVCISVIIGWFVIVTYDGVLCYRYLKAI
jgi:putative MATE family efflux protein